MEVQRSEDWSSISYCCGWGLRASRGPNPLLQAQLGGLRMVPVPWLTSSKPAQMSWSPLHTHTHTPNDQHTYAHSNTSSPQTLSWPLNQNKALRWHFLSQEHSLALWFGICGISSPPPYIFLFLRPTPLPLVLRGLTNGIGCPLTPSIVWFLNDLSMEMSLTLSIQCCPLVQACFQKEN